MTQDKRQPLITVIVPVYNVAAQVAAAIDSLRSQTLVDFEALVIDDGSTDDSAERASAAMAGDPRFRMIRQENRGLSAARNTGLEQACGQFIAFLDSDDRLAPDYLKILHEALEADGGEWAACALRLCLPDGTGSDHSAIHGAPALEGTPRRLPLTDARLVATLFPSAWNKLYRRSFIGDLRFDEGTWFEDHAFFWQLAARQPHLLYVPTPLYLHSRDRPGQITASDDPRALQQIPVLERLVGIITNGGFDNPRQALSQLATRLIHERAEALKNPALRKTFMAAAGAFLKRHDLPWDRAPAPDIQAALAPVVAGCPALSVLLRTDRGTPEAVRATLSALEAQSLPDFELWVVPVPGLSLPQTLENGVALRPLPGTGPALKQAADHAEAKYLLALTPGDLPGAEAFGLWLNALERASAQHPDTPVLGLSDFVFRVGAEQHYECGLGFKAPFGLSAVDVPLSGGYLPLSATRAIALNAEPGALLLPVALLRQNSAPLLAALDGLPEGLEGAALALWAGLHCKAALWFPQPAVMLAQPSPPRPETLGRALADMTDGWPASLTAGLPGTWQKTLALRLAIRWIKAAKGRVRRNGRMLRAALALRLQDLVPAPRHADQTVPPRFARLIGLGPALPPRQPAPLALDFHPQGNGRFECRFDFTHTPYGALDFRDLSGRRILLHLSLRPREGQLVVNRHNGQDWYREKAFAARFDTGPCLLEVRFRGARAAIRLNGEPVATLGPLPRPARSGRFKLRRGFAGLTRIAWAELNIAADPASLVLDSPPPPAPPVPDGVSLNDRLEIVAKGFSGPLNARLPGIAQAQPLLRPAPHTLTRHRPPTDGPVSFLVPGRVWLAAEAGAAVPISVHDAAGRALGEVTLDRAGLIARCEALAGSDRLLWDQLAGLQAIEHTHFAGVWPDLSPETRQALERAADHYGLQGFLRQGTDTRTDSLPDFAPPGPAPADQLRNQFTAAMRHAPDADPAPLLEALLADDRLDLPGRINVALGLTEWFCLHDDPQNLWRAAKAAGLPAFTALGDGWLGSAVTPLLYLEGRWEDLTTELHRLSLPREGWISTPALGWLMMALANQHPAGDGLPPPQAVQETLIAALLDTLTARAADYWDRTPCLKLTEGAAALLTRRDLPPALCQQREMALLQAYALSPAFWACVRRLRVPLPPRLADARTSFEHLEALIIDDAAPDVLEPLLAQFESWSTSDLTRFRRDLLGPSGVASRTGVLPDASALARTTTPPAEALLRWMAYPDPAPHPALSPSEAETLRNAAREAVPAVWTQVPQMPHGEDLRALTQAALHLLNAPDSAGTAALAERLAPLVSAGAGFSGVALGFGLCAGLLRAGHSPDPLINALERAVAGLPANALQALQQACAPRMALGTLHRLAPDSPVTTRAAALLDATPTPLPDQVPDLSTAANPLFDTLVCVVSCAPYLDSRIPALQAGWLDLLDSLGVPWLVMVGGGNGERRGNVVHLDAPDDYEGLPDKVLAMVRWVEANTPFARLIKIDDDCFLNVDAYFPGFVAQTADYHGRPLTRVRGQMDRAWHMAKSTSPRGRHELDKSPEPSRYADGGSGYSLSRRAMTALIDAADSPEGKALARLSFMEDKLVGDLLALRGIGVSGLDYRASVLRRSRPGGPLVSQWENGFLPFSGAPIALAHLDGHDRQADVLAGRTDPWPKPSKIWPSYQPVRLGAQSNALELLSPSNRLAHATKVPVAVVAVLRNEREMLPHFLAHYRQLGIDAFLIADNGSDDGTLDYLLDQPDVTLFSVDTPYGHSQYGVAWQQALLSAYRCGKWTVLADADELLFWSLERRESLPDLLQSPAFETADAARVYMLDFYPEGSLAQADFTRGDPFDLAPCVEREPFLTVSGGCGPFSDAPTFTSALRHRLIPGSRPELFVAQKLALLKYRPWMRLSAGLHFVANTRLAKRELLFAHFKYNSAFRAKAQAEVGRGEHFNNAEEYRRYLALLSEGRDQIHDPWHSVHWRENAFVRKLCAR